MLDVLLVTTDDEVKIVFETLEKRGVLRVRTAPDLSLAQYGISFATPDCTFVHSRVSSLSIDLMVNDVKEILPSDAKFAFIVDDPLEKAQAERYGVRYLDLSQGAEPLKNEILNVLAEVTQPKRLVNCQDEESGAGGPVITVGTGECEADGRREDEYPEIVPGSNCGYGEPDQVHERAPLETSASSIRQCPTLREMMGNEEFFAADAGRRPRWKYLFELRPIWVAVILIPAIFCLFRWISANPKRPAIVPWVTSALGERGAVRSRGRPSTPRPGGSSADSSGALSRR